MDDYEEISDKYVALIFNREIFSESEGLLERIVREKHPKLILVGEKDEVLTDKIDNIVSLPVSGSTIFSAAIGPFTISSTSSTEEIYFDGRRYPLREPLLIDVNEFSYRVCEIDDNEGKPSYREVYRNE
ncbi:MAG: hypothetical protein J7K73_02545 [Nanoarchaeota archaeon]|nr:hypothetical protein [Nanoarchaeota archaeon]